MRRFLIPVLAMLLLPTWADAGPIRQFFADRRAAKQNQCCPVYHTTIYNPGCPDDRCPLRGG